jgi:hypothetical protein
MWDSIQNQNDEKLKYIVDNFLPTSGGTMTGTIVSNLEAIKNIDDESNIKILGGTDDTSSYIGIWAKNNSATPGVIQLRTSDGTNNKSLLAYPNGDLTWAGNNVLTDGFVGNIVSNSEGDKSVPTNTSVTVTTVSLSKGVWVVTGHVMYDAVSGHNYGAQVVDSQYFTYAQDGAVSVAPGSNQPIALQPTRIFNLQSTTTINLNAYTAGGTATAKGNILTAVRIA